MPASMQRWLSFCSLIRRIVISLGIARAFVYGHYERLARALGNGMTGLPSTATTVDYPDIDALRALDTATRYKANPVQRVWFYLSLQRAEYSLDHVLYRTLFIDMGDIVVARVGEDEMAAALIKMGLDAEERHREHMGKFGRYPCRIKWLGRESSLGIQTWLDGKTVRFGRVNGQGPLF